VRILKKPKPKKPELIKRKKPKVVPKKKKHKKGTFREVFKEKGLEPEPTLQDRFDAVSKNIKFVDSFGDSENLDYEEQKQKDDAVKSTADELEELRTDFVKRHPRKETLLRWPWILKTAPPTLKRVLRHIIRNTMTHRQTEKFVEKHIRKIAKVPVAMLKDKKGNIQMPVIFKPDYNEMTAEVGRKKWTCRAYLQRLCEIGAAFDLGKVGSTGNKAFAVGYWAKGFDKKKQKPQPQRIWFWKKTSHAKLFKDFELKSQR
jgi:hypothetical protein